MIRSYLQRLPFFYGWVIVACTMSTSIARQAAAVATLSIFVVPMTTEFDWSRTGISGAVSLGGLLGAVAAPFIGPLFDRHGSRALLAGSGIVVCIACIALAGTESLLWFYVAFSISRLMFSTPFDLGTTSAIAKWFVRRRARAMSFLTMAAGIGLTIVPLTAAIAIALDGWRAGWLTLAVLVVLLGVIPQWLFLVRAPEDIGLRPDGDGADETDTSHRPADAGRAEVTFTRAEAIRTPTLWLMMAFTFLVFPVQAGVSLHQAPHLIERGISPTIAATIISVFSITTALSSFGFGFVGDRFPVRVSLACCAATMALGAMAMLAVDGPLTGYLAAAIFGAGLGGILTMIPVAWANYFGRAHYGAIRGFTLPAQVGGQAVGPLVAGVLHDLTGDYTNGLLTFAVLSVAAAGIAFVTPAPHTRMR